MATHKENYKSDIRLAVQLTLSGEPIPVPTHDFMLRFSVGCGCSHYDCSYLDEECVNCAIDRENNKVMCFLDNHDLGIGELHCEYYDYIPDTDFADGNMRKVVPSVLPVELIAGAGDDAEEIDVDVPTDVYGAIAECEAATTSATLAAEAANTATALANAAATEAYAKATEATTATANANRAASAADDITAQARIATSDAMTAAQEAGDARDLAEVATRRANTAAENANTAAEGASASATRAEQAATTANNAAQRAEQAAEQATTLFPTVEALERAITTDDAEISFANYATIQFESLGVNIDGKGVNIKFTANNQLRYQDAEKSQTLSIANGTTYTVYQGYGLYYDVKNNRIVLQEAPASGEYVTLAIVNRGLITQGKVLELTEHYARTQGADMSDYYTKSQIDSRLNGYERHVDLLTDMSGYTYIAAHFTGGTLDGTWRYYKGAKSLADIITGTAEQTDYDTFVRALSYKVQGLDAIKCVVMDIVSDTNGETKSVDYIPFVGLCGQGTALFTLLGNSADNSAEATDIVKVVYMLDLDLQSWSRSEYDFTNHIIQAELELSQLSSALAAKANTTDVANTYATITALSGKADKVAVTSVIPQSGLLPNVVYNLGTTDSVNVVLDTSDTSSELKIWSFKFTAQSASCSVSLPAGVELGNEYDWEFLAGRVFEVSIMDNVALVAYADPTNS